MTFLRIFYLWAALGTLFTDVATAQEAAKHLFLDDAIETLDYDFARHPPHLRAGAVQLDSVPLPFNDSEFSWAAGYIWSHPLGNGRLPMPLPRSHFPAWTSNGTMEVSPNGDMITQVLGTERSP